MRRHRSCKGFEVDKLPLDPVVHDLAIRDRDLGVALFGRMEWYISDTNH